MRLRLSAAPQNSFIDNYDMDWHCCQIVSDLSGQSSRKIWKNSATTENSVWSNFLDTFWTKKAKKFQYSTAYFLLITKEKSKKIQRIIRFHLKKIVKDFPASFLLLMYNFCNFTASNFFRPRTFFGVLFCVIWPEIRPSGTSVDWMKCCFTSYTACFTFLLHLYSEMKQYFARFRYSATNFSLIFLHAKTKTLFGEKAKETLK
jgi:hypothetical protein